MFTLLSNPRRRGVLYALKRDGEATVEDLAARIATWQGENREPSPEEVHTSLVHSHLPKLDDANVVDYDRESEVVELRDTADLDPYLYVTNQSEPSFSDTGRQARFAD